MLDSAANASFRGDSMQNLTFVGSIAAPRCHWLTPVAAARADAEPTKRFPQLTIDELSGQPRALAEEILKISSIGPGRALQRDAAQPGDGRPPVATARLPAVQHLGAAAPERVRDPDPGATVDVAGRVVRALSAGDQGGAVGSGRRRSEGRPAPRVDAGRRSGRLRPLHGALDEPRGQRRDVRARPRSLHAISRSST